MIYSKIISTGSYLPKKILKNNGLKNFIDTTDSWITKRTGIKQRHIANNKFETTTNMGYLAALDAIKQENIKKSNIDMIIVATSTPDRIFPSTACVIQKKLNIQNCSAFDIQAACSGFIYAISIADNFIKTGFVNKILIIGTESNSKIINWKDKISCILFGDGAGAIILKKSKYPGIISTKLNALGKFDNILYTSNKKPYIIMNGNKVFKLAVKYLYTISMNIIKDNNIKIKNIDWIIPHQANIRIIKLVAKKLNIPLNKIIITLKHFANTACASIPIAINYGIRHNKIKKNQLLLLQTFGAGLTWGSALIKY